MSLGWSFLTGAGLALACLAAASGSTPDSATPQATPQVACDAPPRSYPAMIGLLTASDIETPAATTGGQTLPEGRPADEESIALMETTIRAWLACQNAGEPLRAWSLFSEGYLYRLLGRQGALTSEAYAALATPSPAEARAELLEVRDHRLFPDGRFGATVVIAYPSVPMPKQFFFYFTRADNRLVIDGILGEISFSVP